MGAPLLFHRTYDIIHVLNKKIPTKSELDRADKS